MAWKKRALCEEAFAEIGLASYVFDISPEEMTSAVRRLDGMMAEWDSVGIRIGYALPSQDDGSDPDEDSGVPDTSLEAIRTNLALRMAPSYGKTPTAETKKTAATSYRRLLTRCLQTIPVQADGSLPRGAGNKPWRSDTSPYFPADRDPLTTGPDSTLDFH